MSSKVIRLPERTVAEASAASRLFGCSPGELLAQAWEHYRETSAFQETFTTAQKAFAAGDLAYITRHLEESARDRASSHVANIRAMRQESAE